MMTKCSRSALCTADLSPGRPRTGPWVASFCASPNLLSWKSFLPIPALLKLRSKEDFLELVVEENASVEDVVDGGNDEEEEEAQRHV